MYIWGVCWAKRETHAEQEHVDETDRIRFSCAGNRADGAAGTDSHHAAHVRWHGRQHPWGAAGPDRRWDFYGTTSNGGANGSGTVFKIIPGGSLTTIYNFCSQSGCTDGSEPNGLVQAANGDFYGTTGSGGANNYGTVFKITSAGTLTTLYSFCSQYGCTDGRNPESGLVQAMNGDFYGTTYYGGAGTGDYIGDGTIFKITPNGAFTTLYSFCPQYGCPDGAYPEGVLVQATDGDLYGTTFKGGANEFQAGAIFKITAGGTFTSVYSFFCSPSGCWDGVNPQAGLIQASNGDFYGTTTSRGPLEGGTLAAGTVFRMTPSGTLTTLSGFTCKEHVCPNGTIPEGG